MSTVVTSAPAAAYSATVASNAAAQPSARGPSSSGTPIRNRPVWTCAGSARQVRANDASSTVRANSDTQSMLAQAGTTPSVGSRPGVGLSPTIPLNAAGTRPEPAVSVPRARSAMPSATATAEPELDPPDTYAGSTALRTAPYGLRV